MLDRLRELYPKFGFALYAMEPGGLVTLEVIAEDGELFSFKDETEEAVCRQAFPKEFPERTPDVPTNVFD